MDEDKHFVKLSGIPYSASIADISRFLGGCDIKGGKNNGITITKDGSGRHSGRCYVELLSNDDVKFAMKKDKQYMKDRWINVEVSSEQEKLHDVSEYGVHAGSGGFEDGEGDNIVQCRGLPWRAGPAEISCFFAGCDLKANKAESIHIIKNPEGRPTGQAFVEFLSAKDMDLALKKHKEYMGHRFVEVISATRKHMETTLADCKVHDENREPVLYMRGLPFDCNDDDIKEFFKPLEVIRTQIVKNGMGRSIGEAFAEFVSLTESDRGMTKFGQKIGKRYIEIFQSHSKYWCDTRDPNKEHHVDSRYPDNRSNRDWNRYDSRVTPYARDRYGARFRGGGNAGGGGNMRFNQHGGNNPRRVGGYNRGGGGGVEREGYSNFERPPPMQNDAMVKGGANKHFAIVRGVSVNTSVGDIVKFFSRVVNPKNVELKFEPGTSKGDVVVELHTHGDAMKSMLLDKEPLGASEVHLELKSKPEDYGEFEQDDSFQSASSNQTYNSTAYQHHFDPYSAPSW